MKVTNNTCFTLKACGWYLNMYGKQAIIQPGETKEINGPFLGTLEEKKCHVALEGKIICHEKPDDEENDCFYVGKENQLNLKVTETTGISACHIEEPLYEHESI